MLEGTAVGPLEQVDTCLRELQHLVMAEHIDCGLRLTGCWEIGHGTAAGKRTLPWNDWGHPIYIAKNISGGVVEPARLLSGLLARAARLGVAIREKTPVKRVMAQPRPALEVAGDTIHPEFIVVAVNAWLGEILPAHSRRLRTSLTFACATQRLDDSTLAALGLSEGVPFYTSDLPYLWGRTHSDGRVIFGSGLVFGSPRMLEETDIGTGDARASLRQLQDRVRRLHPQLGKVAFSASWGGPIAFAPDAVPFVGRLPGCRNIIAAGAYAGHGVALSVRVGQLIARAIAENAELPSWGAWDRRPASGTDH